MDTTWIGFIARNGRACKPRYAIELWNFHESVLNNLPRSNNASEGWHTAFHSSFGSSHPTIWKFFDGIKREQARTFAQITKLESAEKLKGSSKYAAVTERLSTIVGSYS